MHNLQKLRVAPSPGYTLVYNDPPFLAVCQGRARARLLQGFCLRLSIAALANRSHLSVIVGSGTRENELHVSTAAGHIVTGPDRPARQSCSVGHLTTTTT